MKLGNKLIKSFGEKEISLVVLETVTSGIVRLKQPMKGASGEHCKTEFYTLKFHVLDRILEDVDRFGSLESFISLLCKS